MTLQKRLIVAVLLAAPLAWMLTIAGTYWRAEHEINELYDTDMLRLAQQTVEVAKLISPTASLRSPAPAREPPADKGDAGLGDLAVAIWRGPGPPLVLDPPALQFSRNEGREGFLDDMVDGARWRLYYLNAPEEDVRVAVGQRIGERNDLVVAYILSQVLPWLIGLPVLITLLILAVRRALKPVRDISGLLERRNPDDATPLPTENTPGELKLLVQAMNGLLARVATLIEQERRLTADAAHELRTPLAALRAQWDVAQRTEDAVELQQVRSSVTRGLERMDRLVAQLLTMARLDSATSADFGCSVDWKRVVELAIGDCVWLANRRDIDIDVEWPPAGNDPLPMAGSTDSLAVMLKNLLDNAIRYAPRHSRVRLTFTGSRIHVDDEGPGVAPDVLPRLGDRFFRVMGNEEAGSGLGVSIARRIALNHGLAVQYAMRGADRDFGQGLRVTILRGNQDPGPLSSSPGAGRDNIRD